MGSFNFNVMESAYYGDAFIKNVLTHTVSIEWSSRKIKYMLLEWSHLLSKPQYIVISSLHAIFK